MNINPPEKPTRTNLLKYMSELDLEVRWSNYQGTTMRKEYFPRKKFSDNTANSLTETIVKFLNNAGHQAERIRSEGRMIDNTKNVTDVLGRTKRIGSVKWVKSTSTNGTADVSATIRVDVGGRILGVSVKWEVKMRDKQSDAQKRYEDAVRNAGGYYFLVHNIEEFWAQYQSVLSGNPITLF